MGACQSTNGAAQGAESSKRVQFSTPNLEVNAPSDYSGSAPSTPKGTSQQMRTVPTMNKVMIFTPAIADSSDSDNDGEVYSDEEEGTQAAAAALPLPLGGAPGDEGEDRSRINSVCSEIPEFIPNLEEDEKRETPINLDWLADLPRSPAESRRNRALSESMEMERRRQQELEELNRPPAPVDPRTLIGARSLKDLLDHKPPPTDKLLFVNYSNLRYDKKNKCMRKRMPRNPEDEDIGEAIMESSTFSRPDSFLVFVSHEWMGDLKAPDGDGGGDGGGDDADANTQHKGRQCDNEEGEKFRILLKAIEKLWTDLAPGMASCYVWCDHMCLNQDIDTGAYTGVSLLNLNICNIMRLCDCMLTPIVDTPENCRSWDYPLPYPLEEDAGKMLAGRDGVDWYEEYRSPAFVGYDNNGCNEQKRQQQVVAKADTPSSSSSSSPAVRANATSTTTATSSSSSTGEKNNHANMSGRGYLQRAWCRLEMLCNAAVPLAEEWILFGLYKQDQTDPVVKARIEHEQEVLAQRHASFRGSLLTEATHGLRPHYIYGSKEELSCRGPIKLPRLTKGLSERLQALEGMCTDEKVDKTIINAVLKQIEATTLPLMDAKNKTGVRWWRRECYSGGRDPSNGAKHGHGTFTFADSSSYTGPWEHNVMSGKDGVLTLANGDVLAGAFAAGKHIGFCHYTSLIGDKYFGELNDKLEKHGQGKLTYVNGDEYEGYWANNQRHHKGRFTYQEGDCFTGFFKSNKMHGYGTWKYVDGGEYSGYFKNNRRHGEGMFTSSEGISFSGTYRRGRKHGMGVTTYPDGVVLECEFDNGEQVDTGTWTRPAKSASEKVASKRDKNGALMVIMTSPSDVPPAPVISTPQHGGRRLELESTLTPQGALLNLSALDED